MANKSSKDGQTWLHHTVVRLVTDNIVRNDIVVPDFNVCTNTRDTTTINTRYKPHRIVKDSHLKERQRWVPLT